MPRPVRILAFGDNVVDCYRGQNLMYPGGNCVNHAVFARRAGAETAYAGAVCDDDAGRLIRNALLGEGVDFTSLRIEPGQTAYCVIETRDGDRVFVGANLGVSIIAPSPADLARLPDFDAVHTGRSSHVDAWLPRFAEATRVSYDLATVHDAERIARVAPHCFLIAFSAGGTSREEALALAQSARAAGARWSLVTRGIEGALLAGEAGVFEAPAQPVDAVDTLGAGDTHIANVLVGLLDNRHPETILREAADAAARTCLTRGAFGYAATMNVDLSQMMSLEEIYRTTRPANAPEEI
ncbi:PfkB family carbohydrate kinase [Sinorhizobium meliloti]|jgi:fructoselysine 6-kinase|uniref:PfkB family carbohydrate kinase n=1 Tax=Rhizobium meliloti TaxID=382 RepID=UPI000305AB11|nr:PfkB family carbohydrate kinase [Sinorhizobium meliloti]MDE3761871.1 ribokinase [Sinorhizobium meliloti]MDW9805669.1 ribokinase [Sinorhizobium meliloti]MDW9904683.1 ribokinase [Sinorhizobium meliloti]MDX0008298.1 ribokinase [Sinorhizobium meliloti]MDX0225651.1 ribokinase [Sinorhizobium meliloti]